MLPTDGHETNHRRGQSPAVATPHRLQRSRRAGAVTPHGGLYVGRPTIWSNPFERRPRIGHARSVILFDAWLRDQLDAYILGRAGFGEHEIAALGRFHRRLLQRLHHLRGFNLECWCPLTSPWCHADILLARANRGALQ